jgi:hypothetical protein
LKLRAGDWVEVRSKEEILRSLDKNGRLEELPFMPQMFQFCGQRFRVFKRAHKTCDTVNHTGGRRLPHAVHLEHRCDGEAYGGCQAACLIFWKDAWLKAVDEVGRPAGKSLGQQPPPAQEACCTESDVMAGTRHDFKPDDGDPRYICQATQLPYFTTWLPWWDMAQYLEDFTSGNVTAGRMLRGGIYAAFYNLAQSGIGLGRPLRWSYDKFQSIYGGIPYPRRTGRIPKGSRTPTCTLNLQPGELVRVKSYQDILATLDVGHKNHGLYFDAEEAVHCGRLFRVRARVNKYINENTGKLKTLKDTCVILENAWCQARYSNCRMFCPRSIYSWWREVWLERVSEDTSGLSEANREIPADTKKGMIGYGGPGP